MAIYDNLPYTNFHELNADWLLKQMKEAKAKIDEYQEVLDGFEEDYQVLLGLASALTVAGSNVTVAGTLTAAALIGNLTGNVTGNLSGNASTATHATSADSATNATNANYATSAGSANTATTATTATNAGHATTATSATNASHATTADSATSATSATSADHATTADSATTATTATSATTATNADYAVEAGSVNGQPGIASSDLDYAYSPTDKVSFHRFLSTASNRPSAMSQGVVMSFTNNLAGNTVITQYAFGIYPMGGGADGTCIASRYGTCTGEDKNPQDDTFTWTPWTKLAPNS